MWSTAAVSVFASTTLPIIAVSICKTSGKPKKGTKNDADSKEPKGTLSAENKKGTSAEVQNPKEKENAIQASKQRKILVPGSPASCESPQTKSGEVSLRLEQRANKCTKPIPRRGAIKQNVRAPNFDMDPPSLDHSGSNSNSRKLSHRASESNLNSEE